MSPEQFRRIEELYHAAREGTPEERAALLAQSDPELRREVESLLAGCSGGEFQDRRAVRNALEPLGDATVNRLDLSAGLDPYRIENRLGEGGLVAGKYQLLEVLGRGGMGIVYRAEDIKLHRAVALKFLPADRMSAPEVRKRFVVEARAAAALSHPHICTIHEIHDEGEAPFIAMECVEGQSLRARIKDGPIPIEQTVSLAMQVADALAEAHRKGIVHRDIKSANIMVTASGQAKLLDFGLAKLVGETLYTREGTLLGTAAYMSPEQARSETVDHRTDLWSLGVVLYEMLTGQLPFTGDRDISILYAVAHREPKPLEETRPGIPPELQRVAIKALKRDLHQRYASADEMLRDLRQYQDRVTAEKLGVLKPGAVLRRMLKPRIAIPAAACLMVLTAGAAWFLYRQSKIRWAREKALPEIARLARNPEVGRANMSNAYALATEAERYIGGDPELLRLIDLCSVETSIMTTPPGARISTKEYSAADDSWQYLGVSAAQRFRVPRGLAAWKMQKEGYATVEAASSPPAPVMRSLDPVDRIPVGMVRVAGRATAAGTVDEFLIDKYEVTNRQYKQFVDAGGYRERKYWKHKFLKDGKELSWEQASAEFLDQTGRSGPSTWQAGDFPNGQADYPVSGVSWYEAAAYAEYAGKTLPSSHHWGAAMGLPGLDGWALLTRLSNFKGEGPSPVGSYRGMSAWGAFDMGGNVREWCWNVTRRGRVVRGGAWNDATYMALNVSQASAFDRSPRNGFRCAVYLDPAKVDAKLLAPLDPSIPDFPDFYQMVPPSDAVFQVYADRFSYDRKELNPRLETRKESSDWVQERIVVDAAYGSEKLPMHLFLPRRASPPYQVVIYFPSSTVMLQPPPSSDIEHWQEFEQHLLFLVKNGRAVLCPIYKGTFERREDVLFKIHGGAPTRQHTDFLIQLVKDFRVSIDYLETRPDIDRQKVAYLGYSWGSRLAPSILAVEPRVRTSILANGGLRARERPEAAQMNYVTRVRIPILLLNGRYDFVFPFEISVKPLFDLLGTPAKDKVQKVYDSDHFIPQNELVKETLAWLDRYLGPVK